MLGDFRTTGADHRPIILRGTSKHETSNIPRFLPRPGFPASQTFVGSLQAARLTAPGHHLMADQAPGKIPRHPRNDSSVSRPPAVGPASRSIPHRASRQQEPCHQSPPWPNNRRHHRCRKASTACRRLPQPMAPKPDRPATQNARARTPTTITGQAPSRCCRQTYRRRQCRYIIHRSQRPCRKPSPKPRPSILRHGRFS